MSVGGWTVIIPVFLEVDLELDFLAPFLVKHGGVEAMTRKVALQVRSFERLTTFVQEDRAFFAR